MDNKHKSLENLIQELKELRQELAETKQRLKVFQGIAAYTADLENLVGPDGKLLWINQLVYDLSGYKAEECYEMHDYPLPLIYEADKEKAKQCFQSAVEEGSGHDVELRIVCKDGGIKWVSTS
jgi:PAS domain S-box-containing protein